MSQTKVQQDIGVAVAKLAMDTGRENTEQLTEIANNIIADPNIGNIIDVSI